MKANELRKNGTAKHGEQKAYKTISNESDDPVTTVENIINRLNTFGTAF